MRAGTLGTTWLGARTLGIAPLSLAIAAMIGCATEPERSPPPATTSYQNCPEIRHEMARVESIAEAAAVTLPPLYAMNVRVKARERMAGLQTRSSELGCRAAFSDAPQGMSFDQCFAKCRELTDRTDEACFDACR